eukprot:4114365-Prymnesium_polylepis.1
MQGQGAARQIEAEGALHVLVEDVMEPRLDDAADTAAEHWSAEALSGCAYAFAMICAKMCHVAS